MKCATIFYHKNALSIYQKEWIDQCVNSIKAQTFIEFDVYEHNYGGGDERFAEGIKPRYYFLNKEFPNHIGAMNYLYSLCFSQSYDVVFNTNLDDFYDIRRFEKQLFQLQRGAHLVSSNFYYVDEQSVVFKNMNMLAKGPLFVNLEKGHNTICHPCVAMHKLFWQDDLHFDESLLGSEDLNLWQRGIKAGKLFYICPEYLCFYRRHKSQITALKKPTVALLIIATGKYNRYVEPLLESAELFFLQDCDVSYNIFTDDLNFTERFDRDPYNRNIYFHKIQHEPWPYVTLHRFHTFQKYKEELQGYDYYFYIDADTLFKAPINAIDILSDFTAVRHCGFTGKRGTYEERPESTSYVAPNEGTRYYGGGFYGGNEECFWSFINMASWFVSADSEKGIIPVHNDESVLNRLLINSPPTKVLSPSYHYPEGNIERYKRMWGRDYECKILLVEKNHEEIRN